MGRSQMHAPHPIIVEHAGGAFTVPAARGWSCSGHLRLLYSRRSNPQRWVAVGAYCDGCGKSSVHSDKQLAEEDIRDASRRATEEGPAAPPWSPDEWAAALRDFQDGDDPSTGRT